MTDNLSISRRSANMRKIGSKNTAPEMRVRRLAFGMGYRYRLHSGKLPGKPDIVFLSRKKVIFIHGCFWHQHEACREGRTPNSNVGYWGPKLKRNVQRDSRAQEALRVQGWESLVIWECQTVDERKLRDILVSYLQL